MQIKFYIVENPSPQICEMIEQLYPTNPFYSSLYIKWRQLEGFETLIVGATEADKIIVGCPAFLKKGFLSKAFEIDSLPQINDEVTRDIFWQGIMAFCKKNGVSDMEINSFDSENITIPNLPGQFRRKNRWEYQLDLKGTDLWKLLRKRHHYSVNKGKKANIQIINRNDAEACRAHLDVSQISKDRRRERGENITGSMPFDYCMNLVKSGAGVFYQVERDGMILSSILLLKSTHGAYAHSAGTSTDGMECGAAQFLWHEVSKILQSEGIKVFNMAGFDQLNSGLAKYKAGFGGRIVALESASTYIGNPLKKKIRTAAHILRYDQMQFLRELAGRMEHYVVFGAVTDEITPAVPPIEGLTLRKMTDEELMNLTKREDELREYSERLVYRGYNDAYAVYLNDELAHVNWLINADRDRTFPLRNVKLRDNEGEITHGITVKEFRGKGISPFCIRSLCCLARQKGIKRIYSITNIANVASQKAIQKGGLTKQGHLFRLVFDYLPGHPYITIRGHRWRLRNLI